MISPLYSIGTYDSGRGGGVGDAEALLGELGPVRVGGQVQGHGDPVLENGTAVGPGRRPPSELEAVGAAGGPRLHIARRSGHWAESKLLTILNILKF